MVKYELKSKSAWSFLKVAFIINLITGFLLGLFLTPFLSFFLMFFSSVIEMQFQIDISSSSIESFLVISPLLTAFFFTFFVTFFEWIAILLYNLFANLLGGIILSLAGEEIKSDNIVRESSHVKTVISPAAPAVKARDVEQQSDAPPPPPPPVFEKSDAVHEIDVEIVEKPKDEKREMITEPVRVRLAPSPSGYLHVGTARMAIANYLFARHTKGQFLIRIENTDVARSDNSLIEPILSALDWLGIQSDEEIVYQSDRLDLYKTAAQKILESGHGYRCFCTQEQLAADREEAQANKGPLQYNRRCLNLSKEEVDQKLRAGIPYTIRLKIPDGQTTFTDLVSGDLKRDNKEIEDFIIARSDSSATYNLAVVVDDNDMRISHVLRGNDHITNTFKQIHIYHALGFKLPVFGHVPLILRPDKKKVSKRLGDKDVAQYRKEGILPEAMFNFLCMLGWSPKNDREIYNRDELIDIFNEHNFNSSNAIFDEQKLEAFNMEHIQLKSDHDIAMQVAPMLVDAGYTTKYWLETRWEFLRDLVAILKPRCRRMSDFVEQSAYFFQFDYKYDEKADAKNFTPEAAEILLQLADRFDNIADYKKESIESALSELAKEKEIKKGVLIHPTRLAVSGVPHGPGLYDILYLVGQKEVVQRMHKAVDYIKQK
ncbi:MAG: glutamate--tRNA ligase [Calditrichaeota bacterium]|nr:MAG: glutamate--tRNA ligase [Calditrichota bacterium]